LNGKRTLYLVIFALAGLVIGFILGALGPGIRGGRERDLRERLEQVNRDLRTAIDSQREAAERASRLQEELLGITEHARNIEEGTGRLAEQLDGIIDQSGELAGGIIRAQDSLEQSRILLDEFGNILRGLP
jgi:type II secretory pathway pseudopilin PulG